MLIQTNTVSELVPNREFARPATGKQIESVVEALEANNIHVIVVENGEEAKAQVLKLVPQGAEVYANVSATLEAIGIKDEIDKSGHYDAVHPKVLSLDRMTQADDIRILRSRPTYIIGSVHAITEDGRMLTASNGGSQLAPYSYGAKKVILVVGTQKIVKDLNEGFRRIEEYSYPLEDARLRTTLGAPSAIGKVLVVNHEILPGRTTVILVKEELGY